MFKKSLVLISILGFFGCGGGGGSSSGSSVNSQSDDTVTLEGSGEFALHDLEGDERSLYGVILDGKSYFSGDSAFYGVANVTDTIELSLSSVTEGFRSYFFNDFFHDYGNDNYILYSDDDRYMIHRSASVFTSESDIEGAWSHGMMFSSGSGNITLISDPYCSTDITYKYEKFNLYSFIGVIWGCEEVERDGNIEGVIALSIDSEQLGETMSIYSSLDNGETHYNVTSKI